MRKGKFHLAFCKCQKDEDPVQSGLALTPSDMLRLQSQGLPISSQIAGAQYDEGKVNIDFEPPLWNRRGIDMADLWEAEMDVKHAIGNSLKFKAKSNAPAVQSNAE